MLGFPVCPVSICVNIVVHLTLIMGETVKVVLDQPFFVFCRGLNWEGECVWYCPCICDTRRAVIERTEPGI
jgi:hypothetical protein